MIASHTASRTTRTAGAAAAGDHSVQFYEDDAFLVESVGRFISSALSSGSIAIVVATGPHRDGLLQELQLRGMDVASATQEGRYIALDAAETLNRILAHGVPNRKNFVAVIGEIVKDATSKLKSGCRLTIFGEMVAILWNQGKHEAAVKLEEFWNDLAQSHSFSLLCAYKMKNFERTEDYKKFFKICNQHTHVNPAESYPAQGSENQRRRNVAHLQRKTRALETEVRLSQQKVLLLQNLTDAGTWEMDLQDDTLSISLHTAKLLGITPCGQISIPQLLDLMYYSGDRDTFLEALKKARTGRKEFVVDFRVSRGSETRMLAIRGRTFYNGGQPIVLGVVSDTTPVENEHLHSRTASR
jgi:KaiC/GvpD/RAD55 family RecA-like ATPase